MVSRVSPPASQLRNQPVPLPPRGPQTTLQLGLEDPPSCSRTALFPAVIMTDLSAFPESAPWGSFVSPAPSKVTDTRYTPAGI